MQLGVPVEWITESNEEVLSHQESFHPLKNVTLWKNLTILLLITMVLLHHKAQDFCS